MNRSGTPDCKAEAIFVALWIVGEKFNNNCDKLHVPDNLFKTCKSRNHKVSNHSYTLCNRSWRSLVEVGTSFKATLTCCARTQLKATVCERCFDGNDKTRGRRSKGINTDCKIPLNNSRVDPLRKTIDESQLLLLTLQTYKQNWLFMVSASIVFL